MPDNQGNGRHRGDTSWDSLASGKVNAFLSQTREVILDLQSGVFGFGLILTHYFAWTHLLVLGGDVRLSPAMCL